MTLARRRAGIRLAWCLLLAPWLSASTCDDVDLSGRYVLTLDEGSAQAVGAWRQPFVGRLAVDFGLTNPGDRDTTYRLSAQVQTSGEPTDAACTALARDQAVAIDLVPADVDDDLIPQAGATPTLLRDPGTTWEARTPGDGTGFAELRVRNAGTYAFAFDTSDVELTVITGERTIVVPESAAVGAEGCDVLGARWEVPLDEGTYRLRLATDGPRTVRMHIDETCRTLRTVPRTCPGAVSDIVVREPAPTLEPGGFTSGRLSTAELGIGDEVVVELRCASPENCAGELELFFVVEQLACRTDNDCTNVETCSDDGYCLRSASSGCASAGRSSASWGWPWWWLPALLLLRRRSMPRTRDGHRSTCSRAYRRDRSPAT